MTISPTSALRMPFQEQLPASYGIQINLNVSLLDCCKQT